MNKCIQIKINNKKRKKRRKRKRIKIQKNRVLIKIMKSQEKIPYLPLTIRRIYKPYKNSGKKHLLI
jgi:hypothetical protein